MRAAQFVLGLTLVFGATLAALPASAFQPDAAANNGQGLVIELDNQFIKKYENLAMMTTEHTIKGISAVHKPAADGEVHIGGWVHEAGMPGVVEIMNVAHAGKAALTAVKAAGNQKVIVTGAWRLWGEHPGTGAQLQSIGAQIPNELPGEFPSNPDHVFEIHPVAMIKIGNNETPATEAIGTTKGFTPHDPEKAFVLGYEKLTCKIIPKGNRTRIVTQSLGFNFTEFVIRLGENPVKLDDGHAAICSVFDTDGELLVRGRRMVFMKGTEADDHFATLSKGKRMKVIGIPRISLKLLQWRLDHQNDQFDISPLEWHLPYEMIIVSGDPISGDED